MQKGGVIACFKKILGRGGSFPPPPNNLAYPKNLNYNRVNGASNLGKLGCPYNCIYLVRSEIIHVNHYSVSEG